MVGVFEHFKPIELLPAVGLQSWVNGTDFMDTSYGIVPWLHDPTTELRSVASCCMIPPRSDRVLAETSAWGEPTKQENGSRSSTNFWPVKESYNEK